jgi:parallel beta-helix repeat protein
VGQPNTPCPNAQYQTITDAINAANPGDTIQICPALYPEQLVITKPLTLLGIGVQGVGRVLLQPPSLVPVGLLPFEAVISVVNTTGVTIQNLSIDASNNTVATCTVGLAGIHYYNSSGTVDSNVILGARLTDPQTCSTLFPGNGFGVQVDKDANLNSPFQVTIRRNSIHNFTRNGVLVVGAGETADIDGNSISGVGPSTGGNQFGVFIANGAVGHVTGNMMDEGACGALSRTDCINLRSEGVVLRSAGDGTVIDGNTITNAQSGVFLNGANNAVITNNVIRNIDGQSGIHVQFLTNSLIAGNRIFNVGPINAATSQNEEGCGINEVSGTSNLGNTIRDNAVSDAYCGVAYVTADLLESGLYSNTLYSTLNSDNYPIAYPPALEPAQASASSTQSSTREFQPQRK